MVGDGEKHLTGTYVLGLAPLPRHILAGEDRAVISSAPITMVSGHDDSGIMRFLGMWLSTGAFCC